MYAGQITHNFQIQIEGKIWNPLKPLNSHSAVFVVCPDLKIQLIGKEIHCFVYAALENLKVKDMVRLNEYIICTSRCY